MAMSTPTVTNVTTAQFHALHPPSITDSSTAHSLTRLGSISGKRASGTAELWYCPQDNALNIDLLS